MVSGARLTSALLLFMALVVAPGRFDSAFAGPPLSEAARWCLVLVLWLAVAKMVVRPWHAVPRAVPWALGFLLLLAIGVGRSGPVAGWQGVYQLLDEPPATARFAWRFRTHTFRVDRAINFEGTSFGLHFLNDAVRYGQRYHKQFSRDTELPWRVTWRGVAHLTEPGPVVIAVRARGAIIARVGGREVVSHAGPELSFAVTPDITWPEGPVEVEVRYDKPADTVPLVSVQLSTPRGGPLRVGPFGPPEASGSLDRSAAIVMVAAGVLLAGLLLAYALPRPPGAPRTTALIARLALVAAVGHLLISEARRVIPLLHTTAYMWAGDDPLVYVSNARNVLLSGWLMPGNAPLGQGEPFYHYPLFGYVMGLAHWMVGEDFSVIQLVNGWSVAAVLPLSLALGWSRRSWWGILAGTVGMYWLIRHHMLPYAQTGFTDSLFTGLVFATLAACRVAMRPSIPWAAVAGVLCALSAAARPSFLTFTPLLLACLVLWGPLESARDRWRTAAGVALGFVAGLLPFATRNLIVSGKFVVLVSSWIQLPYFLVPPEAPVNPVPALFGGRTPTLVESLGAVISLTASDPWGVVLLEARKIVFTLGLTQFGPSNVTAHPEFLLGMVLFVATLVLRRMPADVRFVTVVFAVSHVAAMVLAAPWTYGYKSILPLHAVFLFAAVHLLPADASPRPPDGSSDTTRT